MSRCGFEITKRIVWRIQEETKGSSMILLSQIRRAIIIEAGSTVECITRHVALLIELGIIKRESRYQYTFSPEKLVV